MSSKVIHLKQAGHNFSTTKALMNTEFYDWACTTAFYTALHYVEAKFYEDPKIIHTNQSYESVKIRLQQMGTDKGVHSWREQLISQKFPTLFSNYRQLQICSQLTRYLENKEKTSTQLVTKGAVERLISDDLESIKKYFGF